MKKIERLKRHASACAPSAPGAKAKREFQVYPCFSLEHNIRRLYRHLARVERQSAQLRWERRLPRRLVGAKLRRHRVARVEA